MRSVPGDEHVGASTFQHIGGDVVVRITDRGPYIRDRIIDVSLAGARRIDMINTGVAPVTIEILGRNPPVESREELIATKVVD